MIFNSLSTFDSILFLVVFAIHDVGKHDHNGFAYIHRCKNLPSALFIQAEDANGGKKMTYRCISADSHLEIRPDRYAQRVPAKYRDRAPKVITLEDGTLAVLQEGQPLERLISNISCGLPYEERRPFDPLPGQNYETSPGTGSPEPPLAQQDKDGAGAEGVFI